MSCMTIGTVRPFRRGVKYRSEEKRGGKANCNNCHNCNNLNREDWALQLTRKGGKMVGMKTGRKTRAQHQAENAIAELRADQVRIQGERLDALTAEVERLRAVTFRLDVELIAATMGEPTQAPELEPLGAEPSEGKVMRRELFREYELRMIAVGQIDTYRVDLFRAGQLVMQGNVSRYWHMASVVEVLRALKPEVDMCRAIQKERAPA